MPGAAGDGAHAVARARQRDVTRHRQRAADLGRANDIQRHRGRGGADAKPMVGFVPNQITAIGIQQVAGIELHRAAGARRRDAGGHAPHVHPIGAIAILHHAVGRVEDHLAGDAGGAWSRPPAQRLATAR